jgi:hypothetical protein
MMAKEGIFIPSEYHVDIQDMFKTDPNYRDGLAKLGGVIIDDSYKKMMNCPSGMHDKWAWKPIAMSSLRYAALDGYVSYQLYNRLITIREGLRLGRPILNDKLYVQSKGGKTYKWLKANTETTFEKRGRLVGRMHTLVVVLVHRRRRQTTISGISQPSSERKLSGIKPDN